MRAREMELLVEHHWHGPAPDAFRHAHVDDHDTHVRDSDEDVRAASARLRAVLQEGIDRCIDSYPVTPEPGAWWMPAHRGGSAITVQEQIDADAREREAYKRTG